MMQLTEVINQACSFPCWRNTFSPILKPRFAEFEFLLFLITRQISAYPISKYYRRPWFQWSPPIHLIAPRFYLVQKDESLSPKQHRDENCQTEATAVIDWERQTFWENKYLFHLFNSFLFLMEQTAIGLQVGSNNSSSWRKLQDNWAISTL